MFIVAIDPGKICGMYWVHITESSSVRSGGEDATAFDTLCNLEYTFQAYTTDEILVACERYTITGQTAKMSRQYDALETIGALRFLCRKNDIDFELQSRASRITVTDATLKKIGWYKKTPGGHTIEAARHLFLQFAKRFPNHDLVRASLDIIS